MMIRSFVSGVILMGLLSTACASSVVWNQQKDHRYFDVTGLLPMKDGFSALKSSTTGIAFTNSLPQSKSLTNQVFFNGSGVAAGDFDGDGWCDLFFCSLDGRNRLYRNLGNWQFEDVTEKAGLGGIYENSSAAALVDINGDGKLDLLFNTVGNGSFLFINEGNGHFKDQTDAFRLRSAKGRTSMAFADINGDGYLDCYITAYRTIGLMDQPGSKFTFKTVNGRQLVQSVNGRPTTEPELLNRFRVNEHGGIEENGEPDDFFINTGGNGFRRIALSGGNFLDEHDQPLASQPLDWGLSVMFRDVNADGTPDLYVCNDFDSDDRFWINDGKGHFHALDRSKWRSTSLFSMGVDFADINRDGRDDFFVLDMLSTRHSRRMNQVGDRKPTVALPGEIETRPAYSRNTLFLQREDGSFAEIASLAGVEASDWSWCPIFLDVDLDGWEDLLISNGNGRDARNTDVANHLREMRAERSMNTAEIFETRKLFPSLDTPNMAFRNNRDLTFTDASKEWGFDLNGVSNGMALADLDNDGDLDVIINNLNGEPALLRNDSTKPRVGIRLRGEGANTQGIGARIKLVGGGITQSQEMICGGRYLSSDEPMRTFAALQPDSELEVLWPSHKISHLHGIKGNRVYEIFESEATLQKPAQKPAEGPGLFESSEALHHVHHENLFDETARQPLLPINLSQAGPGICWADLDGDGNDELLVGAGEAGQLAAFKFSTNGNFVQIPGVWDQALKRDILGLAVVAVDGQTRILASLSNYENGLAEGSSVRQWTPNSSIIDDSIPANSSSPGPIACADVNGDGLVDLFLGGRCKPGQFPMAADSFLYVQKNGRFVLDAQNSSALAQVGLVNGAAFSDLNGDGWPDLILACAWGPIRIFFNQNGHLVEKTQALKLDQLTGWWNAVATGDFDEDGKPDLIVANWGSNTPWQMYRSNGLRIYFAEQSGTDPAQPVEAYLDSASDQWRPIRGLDFLARGLPELRDRFKTHAAFGRAAIQDLWLDFTKVKMLEVTHLESFLLLNRTDHFEAHPLPTEAQFAPAFGCVVADFDGDGHEDLFLAQNFFATRSDIHRMDAGRGLVLRGNGSGGFEPMSGASSGVRIYGDQRGAAAADFDGDGRVDLAVAQNGAETIILHNRGARAGRRVRLKGTAQNPQAIGAQMRIQNTTKGGPVREIQAGSGYLSQNSTTQIFPGVETTESLWIRWPDGKTNVIQLPAKAREVEISFDGKIISR
jgi:hypothetical protein